MRRIIAVASLPVALGAVAVAGFVAWRRNRRFGSAFVNRIVNPRLVSRGLVGGQRSEIGTLEHFGRTSGIRRVTPVHPEPTVDGFRIVMPLGPESQWARNVVAAGHCRLQLHETVYDLDEPSIIEAAEADFLPTAVRLIMSRLGFQYLVLRTFSSAPGTLELTESRGPSPGVPAPTETAAEAAAEVVRAS